jgi:hypothetical protein
MSVAMILHRRGHRAVQLAAGDGERIGFFAGRRRAAPDAGRRLAEPRQMMLQQIEVMRFAEEGGQIRGQRIDEGFPLGVVIALKAADVVGEGRIAGGAQPARQPAVDHVELDRRQRNAGMLMYQFCDAVEIVPREGELSRAAAQPMSHPQVAASRLRSACLSSCLPESRS